MIKHYPRAGNEWDDAVVVALGSNLSGGRGSSVSVLRDALERFPAVGLEVRRLSSWWRSTAWPEPADPDYINAVALVETGLGPPRVLAALHGIEASFGRERKRDRPNAPRVLDLDLIAYGRKVFQTPGLVLPHPRATERRFVMGPLAQIAPSWRHPVSGVSADVLARQARVGGDAAPLGS